jgi:endo-1,4-beta-xylanase
LGDQLDFDLTVTDGTTTVGWNDAGATGTLTLVEPVSFTNVGETATAPVIDGAVDPAWATANAVSTDKQIEGDGGASAVVKTLWQDNTLYVLAHVTDPILDDTGSDPWIEDSVEIYVDAGNVKNGSYRFDDTQIRINFNNVTSFGTGDEAFQANRLESATQIVADGYVVEASISLLEAGGLGTFHGLDFQVNDATGGVRTSIRNWADPTGLGYQSTSRWGVGRLVAEQVPTSISYAGSTKVKTGKPASFGVVLSASEASCVGGQALEFSFDRDPVSGATGPFALGEATTNADGRAKLSVGTTGWTAGTYELTVSYAGNDLGCVGSSMSTEVTVSAKGGPGQ